MSLLQDLLGDLGAETDELRAVVAPLGAEDWARPTPAPGWSIATQVAHLAWTDEAATAAAASVAPAGPADPTAWEALREAALVDGEHVVDRGARALAARPPAELLGRWDVGRLALAVALRGVPEGTRMPWFGPPMSAASMATARFMETWAHGLDVRSALGVAREPTDRIRHVAHLGVHTRDFAYSVHGEQPPDQAFRVELVAPSGEVWAWGPPQGTSSVRGSAYDFCRLVTQRVHRDDTGLVATGPDASHWLDIAQAFAGGPGAGRAPEGGIPRPGRVPGR